MGQKRNDYSYEEGVFKIRVRGKWKTISLDQFKFIEVLGEGYIYSTITIFERL